MIAREEVETEEPEITLSTASLLGLFLALVLVCGLFFGFGYSVGRREATIPVTDIGSTAVAAARVAPPPRRAKPSGSTIQEAENTLAKPITLPVLETPPQEDPASYPEAAPVPKKSIKPAAAPVETGPVTSPIIGPIMVQVAAVFRQEDADVLLSALRQRGYNVVVRHEPQDKLLHVQVGPFASRAQANVMKQKLASDGYNAIIKP